MRELWHALNRQAIGPGQRFSIRTVFCLMGGGGIVFLQLVYLMFLVSIYRFFFVAVVVVADVVLHT